MNIADKYFNKSYKNITKYLNKENNNGLHKL